MVNVVAGNSDQSVRSDGSNPLEERAIARLERVRRDVLRYESDLQQLRQDTEKFGESQGDEKALSERLRDGRRELASAQSELENARKARNTDSGAEDDAVLSNFLEIRRFTRDFPEDARLLKTFQYYTAGGVLGSFSGAAANELGSVVDIRI